MLTGTTIGRNSDGDANAAVSNAFTSNPYTPTSASVGTPTKVRKAGMYESQSASVRTEVTL